MHFQIIFMFYPETKRRALEDMDPLFDARTAEQSQIEDDTESEHVPVGIKAT
jgi:hypothetical protein